MSGVGVVVSSRGTTVEVQVQGDEVELGSILKLSDAYGIVAGLGYREDTKIGSKQELIAEVSVFGRLEGGTLRRIKKPIPPYSEVTLASKEELEEILKVGDAVSFGTVLGTDARAFINASEYDRHTAILASTGAGKSYLAANFISAISKLKLPVVIVDTHGEYQKLVGKATEGTETKIKVYTVRHARAGCERLTIPLSNLSSSDFHHFIPNLTEPQEGALASILERLDGTDYIVDDLVNAVGELDVSKVNEATIMALKRKTSTLKRTFRNVFEKYGTDVSKLVGPGTVTIIDASLASQGVRQSVISYLARQFLNGRINEVNELDGQRTAHPLLLVIEEAHNYAGSDLSHSCKREIARIASEGRKFGLGLCVISQKPSKIDEDILSQCNTGVYMHITNPRDKEHIRRSFECINEAIVADLDSLDVGECIIAGPMLDIPFLLCEVDRLEVEKDKKNKFEFKVPVKADVGEFGYA